MSICYAKMVWITFIRPQIKAEGPSYSQHSIEIIISTTLYPEKFIYMSRPMGPGPLGPLYKSGAEFYEKTRNFW